MRKFLFASALSLAAFLFLVPAQLRADGLNFTFNEDVNNLGAVTVTWQLPANPDPDPAVSQSGVAFGVSGVPMILSVDGTILGPVPGDVLFLNASLPLFQFAMDLDGAMAFSLFGAAQPQFYSGDETSPTFIPGIYSGIDVFNSDANGAPEAATLIIATPEPPSILMYLVGFLALAGVFVVRRVQG